MENLKTALASVGGDFEHVVKLNSYLTDIEANANEFREIRAQYFTNKSTLPAATLVQVVRLANSSFLLEVEMIASYRPKRKSGWPRQPDIVAKPSRSSQQGRAGAGGAA